LAKVLLLGGDELKPGERGYAQIRLKDRVVALPHDRFVLRSSSLIQTIGGGIILDAHPQRHRRFKGDVITLLEQLKAGDPSFALGFHIREGGVRGLEVHKLAGYANIPPSTLSKSLQELLTKKAVIKFDREAERVVDAGIYAQLKDEMITALEQYHAANPLKQGMPKEELKSKLPPQVDGKLFNSLVADLMADKAVVQEKDKVRLSGHHIALEGKQQELEEQIVGIMSKSGLSPPSVKELSAQLKVSEKEVEEILALLVNGGSLVKLKDGVHFHLDPLRKLGERLIAFLKEKGTITTQDFKTLTGVSRKYTIPLAEYFDAIKVTVRVGDERILRGEGKT
jgi:selenocysteine-specific elongation factor